MKRLKRLLHHIPGLIDAYSEMRFLSRIACERWWADLQEQMDRSHLDREWDFEAAFEQERHLRILAAVTHKLGADTWGEILEIGCSDGVFTMQLARRSRSVTACDISRVACARASERCAQYPQVRIEQLNVIHDDIPGNYDLVVAMDVLEYVHGRRRMRQVVTKLVDALRSGGLLVISGCRLLAGFRRGWRARWFLECGDNLVAFLGGSFGLRLVYQELYPGAGQSIPGYQDHVIALFVKNNEARS